VVAPRPFPFHALPRVAASEVEAARALRRAYPTAAVATVAAALRELTGHDGSVELRQRGLSTAQRVDLGVRGPVVVRRDERTVIAIEVEAEFALAAVSALAGGRTLPRVARGRAVDPLVSGALAGVVQHLARACGAEDLAVAEVEPPLEVVRRALGPAPFVAADFAVRIGVLRARARIAATVPEASPPRRLEAPLLLRALGALPRTMSWVVGAGHGRARDLADLRVGDLVVVDVRCSALSGEDADEGLEVARVEADGPALRLGRRRIELAPEPAPVEEPRMSRPDETAVTAQMPVLENASAVADAIAELPVLVRVEAGSVTLSAQEWATLGTGDVVVLDARVGDLVTLRVGGRVAGRGELVEVDGAIGVRLRERAS
jgi:flagellar motor switch/type III secretory pathway protein FliN